MSKFKVTIETQRTTEDREQEFDFSNNEYITGIRFAVLQDGHWLDIVRFPMTLDEDFFVRWAPPSDTEDEMFHDGTG